MSETNHDLTDPESPFDSEHFVQRRILSDEKKGEFKILVSGDSISKGIVFDENSGKYMMIKDNYVSLVQDHLKGIICNAAKFGSTIIKGALRLPDRIMKEQPDAVLLEFGGNDCDFHWDEIAQDPSIEHFPKTDYHVFQNKLEEIILSLKSAGIVPVLATLPPLDADKYFHWISRNNPAAGRNILQWLGSVSKIYWWQERYNSAITSIASKTCTMRIDIRGAFLEYPDFTRFLCLDGIHPNREGHQLIANNILEYINTHFRYLLKEA